MHVALLVSEGCHQGKLIRLRPGTFLIGRESPCHLRAASPLVSKRHCALHVTERQVVLRDLGSTNGTLVNGQRIRGEQVLRPGDEIRVGPLTFVFRAEAPAARSRPKLDEDAIAAMLLEMDEAETSAHGLRAPAPENTLVEVSRGSAAAQPRGSAAPSPAPADTSRAATALLGKYLRPPRP